MPRKIIFGGIWLGFLLYATFFAPPDQPDTLELIKNLSTGNLTGINPLIISLFNLMGIWPIIYTCVLLADGRGQKIRAGIFVALSYAVGAFAILPYLALRQPNREFIGEKNLLIKIFDSRLLGIFLTLASGFLVFWGIKNGDWSNFLQQWQTSKFIHVMSLDFCMLSLLFPTLVGDDMARRGMNNQLFLLITCIPLFGPLIYLCGRSPLLTTEIENINVAEI